MPGLIDPPPSLPPGLGFSIYAQKLWYDIDFATRSIKGRTEITVQPHSKDLRTIRFSCRQTKITYIAIKDHKSPQLRHEDPYSRVDFNVGYGVHQHHLLRQKVQAQLDGGSEDELVLQLPKNFHIEEIEDPFAMSRENATLRLDGDIRIENGDIPVTTEIPKVPGTGEDQAYRYKPIEIILGFDVLGFRDGLQFVGLQKDDPWYPHAFTRSFATPAHPSCLFPCVDDPTARCEWQLSIRCPRTLGDACRKPRSLAPPMINGSTATDVDLPNGESNGTHRADSFNLEDQDEFLMELSEEEKVIDMVVVSCGMLHDEIDDPLDPTRKTVTFRLDTPVTARHLGFAVGPFERCDLASEFRSSDEDDRLGENARPVWGYCLPGRMEELKNTCMVLPTALDYLSTQYSIFPYKSYNICFVENSEADVIDTASLSICSSRLLYPQDILEPLDKVTRQLVFALASQWMGVNITPAGPGDTWIVIGSAYFMTDKFLAYLCGKNEYRYRQKTYADKIFELDVNRPSLYALGSILALDPSEMEFMALKAPAVLFILHNRLIKANGRSGADTCIEKVAKNGKVANMTNNCITTDNFFRVCEKVGHMKLEGFFAQWVYGAGCPDFVVQQRFNKKKLVVEMMIKQTQIDSVSSAKVEPETFMRDAVEEVHKIYAGPLQPLFTGPMTIRIHEADGTPYEHIVDIKEAVTKVEIPYNTKYKRLKRSRRQKERAAAAAGMDVAGDAQDDVLLYCLGDVLQSEEEVLDWQLTDWSKEDEDKMSQESYEWIRMDADFEWICKMDVHMPHYMWVSQLQQDKDVVAQAESIHYLSRMKAAPLLSSILTRTLMDQRYFHGIRTSAAAALTNAAKSEYDWIGFYHLKKAFDEFFCFPDSPMTRPNDFSDRSRYLIQCAIPKAMANIRDEYGKTPMAVKTWFIDKLKFNDNSHNEFSDCHYVATLLLCLAETLIKRIPPGGAYGYQNLTHEAEIAEADFQRKAVEEIERYRRIDEWTSSYQNIYTVTTLDCLKKLTLENVIPRRVEDFMQYTQPGNAPNVRIKAWSSLAEVGAMRHPPLRQYLLYSLESEMSPYMRNEFYRVFGLALGYIALQGNRSRQKTGPLDNGGLVIDQEAADTRAEEIRRSESIEGALESLKNELQTDEGLKDSLKGVLRSDFISLKEFGNFLDICAMLYEPVNSLRVVLKYPRYFKVEHEGKGLLHFVPTKIRTTPLPKAKPPTLPQPKIVFQRKPTLPVPSTSPTPQRPPFHNIINQQQSTPIPPRLSASPAPPPRKTIKLKIGKKNSTALAALASSSASVPMSAPQPSPQPLTSVPGLNSQMPPPASVHPTPPQSKSQPSQPSDPSRNNTNPDVGDALSLPADPNKPKGIKLKIKLNSIKKEEGV
ncbi:hypothetical protein M501DRAFT_240771 [Patellaria atrata CBS 101060]|uniref:Transcription initiation factor TFIID subunit 2 n=1 Tax=Patellaria atrata CBS 101060 TaxID=1346257 RepID=A0A9P4S7I0_9PEZI|nr:hypothetical protein M501DRAFT_240771 [Patellaria atrata CBS 101060]